MIGGGVVQWREPAGADELFAPDGQRSPTVFAQSVVAGHDLRNVGAAGQRREAAEFQVGVGLLEIESEHDAVVVARTRAERVAVADRRLPRLTGQIEGRRVGRS